MHTAARGRLNGIEIFLCVLCDLCVKSGHQVHLLPPMQRIVDGQLQWPAALHPDDGRLADRSRHDRTETGCEVVDRECRAIQSCECSRRCRWCPDSDVTYCVPNGVTRVPISLAGSRDNLIPLSTYLSLAP